MSDEKEYYHIFEHSMSPKELKRYNQLQNLVAEGKIHHLANVDYSNGIPEDFIITLKEEG